MLILSLGMRMICEVSFSVVVCEEESIVRGTCFGRGSFIFFSSSKLEHRFVRMVKWYCVE